ncbi:MAG: hypothetical protein ACREA2_18825 [Blastocatellia bacterium]
MTIRWRAKLARQSHNKVAGVGLLHPLNAWATPNRLVLGQVKVDEKSNEITAVKRNRSSASEALEISSRRKISLLV